jgi:hypothetical protein
MLTHRCTGVAVADLGTSLERIEHEPVETGSNGVRHARIPDPDGNAIALAEPPHSE